MAGDSSGSELIGSVVDLAGLINYQDGAIVSRTLIKKPTGTVTLFAFDQGQELSEHTAPYDAMVQVLDGEAEVTIGGKPLEAHGRPDGHHAGRRAPRRQGRRTLQDAVDDDPVVTVRCIVGSAGRVVRSDVCLGHDPRDVDRILTRRPVKESR